MKINQKEWLTFKNKKEYVLIPYMQEEGMKKEWLQQLLPLDDFLIEDLMREQCPIVIPMQSGWMQVELLPIKKEKSNRIEDLKEAFGGLGKSVKENYQVILEYVHIASLEKAELIQLVVQSILEGAYSFRKAYLTEVNNENIFTMREKLTDEKEEVELTFIVEGAFKEVIEKGVIYGKAINRARTLSNIPNNYLHVKDFTAYAKYLAVFYQLECEVLGRKELEDLHSGGILSVNAGCKEEAQLIILTYRGNQSDALNAVVGKGVMFDAGGYHLKSLEGMDGMKYDMCGAANVLAVIEIVAALKSKANIMVVIPAVENVISQDATKMGDVITTMAGKTVEIWNTDAEGRLILCDALTYAIRKGATSLIDLATLTYSCQGALGSDISGIFANNEVFYQAFMKDTNQTGEKVWRLPLDSIYHRLLENTKTADLINYAPGYGAGASVAACFLETFIENDLPWIHLDIVGTSVCRSERVDKEKGATGVLISTIASYIDSTSI